MVFTDGRDELRAGQGDPCSQETFTSVVERASREDKSVPLYTIGLRGGQNINEPQLRNMAANTGGISQIGEQAVLDDLFQQIIEALNSQLVATMKICQRESEYDISMLVGGGTSNIRPATRRITVPTTCVIPTQTPVPSPTPTLEPLQLFLESFAYDPNREEASFEIRRTGDEPIASYEIRITDGNTSQRIDTITLDDVERAIVPTSFSTSRVSDGEVIIAIRALDADGNVLSTISNDFNILRPTSTPSVTPTASNTPVPVSIGINVVEYDSATDTVLLNMSTRNSSLIRELSITLIDEETNLLVGTYRPAVADTIEVIPSNLRPGVSYTVRLEAESTEGDVFTDQSSFVYTPLLTATPSPTPEPTSTSTPTATPPVLALIDTVELDDAANEFVIRISPQNTALIKSYRVRVINAQTGLQARGEIRNFTLPPYDEMRVDISGLPAGDYLFQLSALDEDSRELAQSEADVSYAPPATITPTPAPLLHRAAARACQR